MKSKSFMLMILSMGFGLIAAIGISQVMKTSKANTQPVTKMGTVLVAADFLDMKEPLTEENVKIENWPLTIIPENAVTSLDDIEDMATKVRMSKGMPIVKSSIGNKKNIGRLTIPEGYKVVAIKVSGDDTISGLLNPGDKVDVIGYFKRRVRGETRQIARTFQKGLKVFSINNKMRATDDRSDGASGRSAIVGVLVTEKQSEEIFFVQKTGEIKLVLRGDYVEGDDDVEDISDIMNLDHNNDHGDGNDDEEVVEEEQYVDVPAQYETGPSMIVWNGGSAEKITFQPGALPQTVGRGGEPAPDYNSPGKEAAEEDFDGNEDIDRELEQDQYQGE